jgi:ABC-2 type transport system ATP-binding protein
MIAVNCVSKSYARRSNTAPALFEISFTVEAGEALALVGPNGAGKSTIMRILSTLTKPSSGSASIAGFSTVEEASQVKNHIGVALQEVGVYPKGKVRQVLLHHARLLGLKRSAAAGQCEWVIELFGLGKVCEQRVHRLSGGTRRRLDLALALLHRPPVLLLDEPTSGLDPLPRHEFWRELAELRAEGTCILLASQSIDEVERLTDRAIALADGRMIRNDDLPAAIRDVWMADAITT